MRALWRNGRSRGSGGNYFRVAVSNRPIFQITSVRRKPLARRTQDLSKLNGAREECRSSRELS
jgi:hypothetical protein